MTKSYILQLVVVNWKYLYYNKFVNSLLAAIAYKLGG